MPYYHFISFLFLLLTFPFLLALTSAAQCHLDDKNGLLAFKSGITADPSGLLSSWQPSADCCTWSGVVCSEINNRVSSLSVFGELDKQNSFLSGTISPSLSKLRFLTGIFLIDLRNISGTIPDLLFHLPNLDSFLIDNSQLSGPLSDSIGALTRISTLSLVGNRFSGTIPTSISKLTNLTMLRLSDNLLTGVIPNGIRQLKSLTTLALDGNRLSGPIPDVFGPSSFTNLQTITLSHNKLTGRIPASISALAPVLQNLQLDHNNLTGEIPSFLGSFKSLYSLDLSSNRFTGLVPKSFENLTISSLNLSHNFLVDPFPIMNLGEIQSLDLSYNSFRFGEIPNWITSLRIIYYSLNLAKCGIKMKLDDWKPKIAYAYGHIDLSDNEISGSPVQLLKTTDNLVSFKASNNQLKFDLEKLRIKETLEELDLGKNNVFGRVTKAVIELKSLNVSYNNLCGSLPPNKFPVATFVGNDCLCGAPLTPCWMMSLGIEA